MQVLDKEVMSKIVPESHYFQVPTFNSNEVNGDGKPKDCKCDFCDRKIKVRMHSRKKLKDCIVI